MAPRKASEENAAAKKAAPAKKEAPAKKAAPAKAEAPAAKKPATKKAAKKATEVIIQSPYGGEISYAEILAKVGEAERFMSESIRTRRTGFAVLRPATLISGNPYTR